MASPLAWAVVWCGGDPPVRAILISVDYADLLAVSLPHNRHHFEEVTVVTSTADVATQQIAAPFAYVVKTDLFYEQGAIFNKWKALEYGLDCMGRYGLICVMDADVLWPKEIPKIDYNPECLYSPLRRMMIDTSKPIPPERLWPKFDLHPNVDEFAGYSQIFHATDHHLGPAPWHETNWKHAGGADSFFQFKWPPSHKIRPPFEVLHLGEAGENWCGRVTPYLDGGVDPAAGDRASLMRRIYHKRRTAPGPKMFDSEKY